MNHEIKTPAGYHVYVDEGTSLVDIERAEPKFFSVKFGKRETFDMYRGALICRHTKTFSDRIPRRLTVVYLCVRYEVMGHLSTYCVATSGVVHSIAQAKRLVDKILEEKEIKYN